MRPRTDLEYRLIPGPAATAPVYTLAAAFGGNVIPAELLRIGMLAAGAILVLVAPLSGRLASDPAAARVRRVLQSGVAVAGLALMAWAALPYLGRHASPHAAASTAAAPAAPSLQIDAVGLASSQLASCPLATAPQVPDGATASVEQMNAARTAFQRYDAATNTYVNCVDSAVARLAAELNKGVSPAELERLEAFGRSAHNTAIDQEQAVADRLNVQIRAFKARHPG